MLGTPNILQLPPYPEQKDGQLAYLEGRRAELNKDERTVLLTAKERLLLNQMRTGVRKKTL